MLFRSRKHDYRRARCIDKIGTGAGGRIARSARRPNSRGPAGSYPPPAGPLLSALVSPGQMWYDIENQVKKRKPRFFNQRANGSLTREARLIFYEVQVKAANAASSGDKSPLGSKVSYDTFEPT